MFNKTKIIKTIVFSIVFFTFLINMANPIYIIYYEVKDFRTINHENQEKFESIIPKNVSYHEVDYSSLCFGAKPDSFLSNYQTLNYFSVLMIKISAIVLLIFSLLLLLYKKQFSMKIFYKLTALLLFSFIIYSAVTLYEVDYDFLYICRDTYFYETKIIPIDRS